MGRAPFLLKLDWFRRQHVVQGIFRCKIESRWKRGWNRKFGARNAALLPAISNKQIATSKTCYHRKLEINRVSLELKTSDK